ncbi:hypothetical protein NDU88_004581 [Pleurodeles waltl]|uniref:Reverse transcriptase n=1 Tax=Pleurodeles waltl TaxID=8319 RepID=A0AAV7LIH5_PLEWA|nr:hypothetical protein NDU88_004581 [Pleurodeles waltl]
MLLHGLRPGNGRFPSDIPARSTFYRGSYSSLMDYFLIDIRIWHKIKDIKVGDHRYSDHFPLLLDWDRWFVELEPIKQAERATPALEVARNQHALRWETIMNKGALLAQMSDLVLRYAAPNTYSLDQTMVKDTEIFASLKALFTRENKARGRLRPAKSNPWFNITCRRAKSALLVALKLWDRAAIAKARRDYADVIKVSKAQWAEDMWQELLVAVKDSNARRVWTLVSNEGRNSSPRPDCHIPPITWVSYFTKLYSHDFDSLAGAEAELDWG